jgi:hypothetical protein
MLALNASFVTLKSNPLAIAPSLQNPMDIYSETPYLAKTHLFSLKYCYCAIFCIVKEFSAEVGKKAPAPNP